MTKVLKLQHGIIEVNDKGMTCEAIAYSKAGKILGRTSAFYEDLAISKLMTILRWDYNHETRNF